MPPRFNINRPPVTDEEIERHKNFDDLVAQFKKQSLKKARGDESWWGRKTVKYSTVIMGVTVMCTITYSLIKNTSNQKVATKNPTPKHDKITTPPTLYNKKQISYKSAGAPRAAAKNTVYQVDNRKGAVINHHTGSVIKVPAHSFKDRKGVEISGEISLGYREFHDVADVIAAGIPMGHDTLGKPHLLETAGMFEISASKDGEPVQLVSGKTLTVELASATSESRFVQYYLDTASGKWKYTGPDHVRIGNDSRAKNPEISNLQYELGTVIPARKDSLDQWLAQRSKIDLPPPAPLVTRKADKKRPSFNLESSREEFPELAAFENVLFEVGPENRNYSEDVHNITWTDLKIKEGPVKGRNYILELTRRDRKERLIVYPVLEEGDYQKAVEDQEKRMAEYNTKAEQKKAEAEKVKRVYEQRKEKLAREESRKREQLTLLAAREERQRTAQLEKNFDSQSSSEKIRRVFAVSRLGLYNSDCPHIMAPAALQASYKVHQTGERIVPQTVYLINHSTRTVDNSRPGAPLRVITGQDYSICLLSRGVFYICGKEEFRAATSSQSKPVVFTVTENRQAADDITSLREALEL